MRPPRGLAVLALTAPLLLVLAFVPDTATATGDPPTVVELFTSQGCSSCPPADRLLTELAPREDVVAIAYHVDYWDHIGWKDPFAARWATDHQRAYARVLGRGYPYTPQMVVDGTRDVVGSRAVAVGNAILASQAEASGRIALTLSRDQGNGDLVVTLPARDLAAPLHVWLVRYSGPHVTRVRAGENRGATLTNSNIARERRLLGQWSGEATELRTALPLPEEAGGGIAVWLQEPGPGAILGAAKLALPAGS